MFTDLMEFESIQPGAFSELACLRTMYVLILLLSLHFRYIIISVTRCTLNLCTLSKVIKEWKRNFFCHFSRFKVLFRRWIIILRLTNLQNIIIDFHSFSPLFLISLLFSFCFHLAIYRMHRSWCIWQQMSSRASLQHLNLCELEINQHPKNVWEQQIYNDKVLLECKNMISGDLNDGYSNNKLYKISNKYILVLIAFCQQCFWVGKYRLVAIRAHFQA